ncbi:HEAT repeat-containing protein 1-like [Mytilus californianus]|uniref:HEAT repeat-containing protein 1-like n=1 Tax=Mytilus californianus TaxID=6549 RepID=UPI00224850D5|nr:HEAT repeat-containing protein 1-like [Mytilus californianus]
MTSLAKQLERLAVPHTQTVFGEDKRKKSLLFDPKEAAGLDKETFFGLGTNGLEELETIDESFEEFEENLFANSSLSFERSIQTKEVNDKLDETIDRFLYRLSPYCLLKPAHKALEWLIYRYHIHQYNVDSLMLCMIPYHESKIFVRVVQLLKLNSKLATKWDWLEEIQKTGVHLSRSALVNHCRTDPGFMALICDTVIKVIKAQESVDETMPQLRTWFAFYMTTAIGVMETGGIKEEFIAMILPHISQGLKSSIPNYKAATYMMIAELFHKVTLKDKLLATLLNTICKYISPRLLTEALSCMLLMFQSQNITGLSKRAFKRLCSQPALVETLVPLCNQYKSDKFILALLERLIPAAIKPINFMTSGSDSNESDTEVGGSTELNVALHRILSDVALEEGQDEVVIRNILDKLMKCSGKFEHEEAVKDFCNKFTVTMRMLESKYPKAVDRSMEDILQNAESDKTRELMEQFMNQMVFSVQHHLVPESSASLTLSLNHRLPTVRQKATEYLLKNLEEAPDDDFVNDVLLNRLRDDDKDVVKAALESGSKIWDLVTEKDELMKVLKLLLEKVDRDSGWKDMMLSILEVLCSCEEDKDDDQILLTLFPFFLITDWKGYEHVAFILNSPLAKRHKLLKHVSQTWGVQKTSGSPIKSPKSPKSPKSHRKKKIEYKGDDNLAENMIDSFGHGLMACTEQQRDNMIIEWMSADLECRGQCFILMILDQLLTLVKTQKEKAFICLQILHMIKKLEIEGDGEITTISKAINSTCNQIFNGKTISFTLVLSVLNRMMAAITLPKKLKDVNYWCYHGNKNAEDQILVVLVEMFDYILDKATQALPCSESFRDLFTETVEVVFPDSDLLFRFLGLLWTQHCNTSESKLEISLPLQARALQIGKIHLQELRSGSFTETDWTTAIINLFLTTTSLNKSIREMSVQCLQIVQNKMEDSAFTPVIKKVLRCLPEIVADPEFIESVMKAVFKSMDEEKEKTPKKKRQSITQANKEEALTMILDVISDKSTPHFIQKSLLELIRHCHSRKILTSLLPKLQQDLKALEDGNNMRVLFDCCKMILERFDPEFGEVIDSDGIPVLMSALKSAVCIDDNEDTIQQFSIYMITKDLYTSLQMESQKKILSTLYSLWTESENPYVPSSIRKTLRHLPLNGSHVADELEQCLSVSNVGTLREAKRKKSRPSEIVKPKEDGFESLSWQRVTVILESVQGKKKLENYHVLLPICFNLMSRILESDDHSSGEYIKQLVLALIHHVCSKVDVDQTQKLIPEQTFNMELIVQCVRSSDNPQTHHQALLVLTVAAELYPEKLLHNIMSVFTFMGDTILRQDDAYSFHIISRILETVIPALVTACGQRKRVHRTVSNKPEDVITMVIRVFVDAFPHIPNHRRLMLFTKLVSIEGDLSYLWRTLLLMTEQVVSKGPVVDTEDESTEKIDSAPDREFRLNLCSHFTLPVQLSAAIDIIDYIMKLPDDKDMESSAKTVSLPKSLGQLKKDDVELFNVQFHTAKQLRHFRYESLQLLISLFTSSTFLSQVSRELNEDLQQDFQKLLEVIMGCLAQLSKSVEKHSDKPTAKFWRALFHKICELLDKVVTILPEKLYLQVVFGLMAHELSHVKRKAMELLNGRLHQQKTEFTGEEEALLLPLVDQLCEVVTTITLTGETSEENAVNGQSAFYSLKLMSRHLGHKNHHTFTKVLKLAIKVFKRRSDNLQVAGCALLCVAELCHSLKAHAIPHLSEFMPLVLKEMKNEERLTSNDLYMLSIVTAIQKVVENLSLFLSPYLEDILFHICNLSTDSLNDEALQKPQLQLRLKSIRHTLATTLPPRVLLPTVASCYHRLEKKEKLSSICSVMSVLEEHIQSMSKEDLTAHIQDLQKFFLDGLNFRFLYCEHPEKQISAVEGSIIETFITMVMKLSESTFRPLLFKLYDWASRDEETKYRVMVFYRLADRLAEKLRSLFTLFASHIVQHAASIIEKNNISKAEEPYFCKGNRGRRLSNQLLCYIFDCLYKCFLYDTEGFVTKERFDSLMQPMVDQIENFHHKDKHYEKRITDHLVPCIVQFAVSSQDDSLWKSISYQILLKTRHDTSKVRYAALQCIDAFHQKLGEDFMPLLPEAIPFLAELMEDDSEEVEKKCQSVIAEMEKTLGEPLKKYF